MTIEACLQYADAIAPNGIETAVKLRWLSEIEGRVRVELYGEKPETLTVIGTDTPTDTELCAPHPYDQLYWMYVVAMIESVNGVAARYEWAAELFNTAYKALAKWLIRQGVR